MTEIAVITGGTRGIGRSTAEFFLKKGFKVFVTYSKNTGCAESMMEQFPALSAYQVDGRCLNQVKDFISHVVTEGRPTVLVNNAGAVNDKILLDISVDDFKDVMDTNFGAVLNYCSVLAPLMAANRFGNIINISSIAATKIKIGNAAYGCSKAAIERLSRGLALELARFNVNVNAVSPGFVDTQMFGVFAKTDRSAIIKSIPARKIMMPEEVARIIYLLGIRHINTTGTILSVGNGENIT